MPAPCSPVTGTREAKCCQSEYGVALRMVDAELVSDSGGETRVGRCEDAPGMKGAAPGLSWGPVPGRRWNADMERAEAAGPLIREGN